MGIVMAAMKLPVSLLGVLVAPFVALSAESPGIAPTDTAGKPLNLGFEKGSLAGWTATGKAWDKQPVKGDTVAPRRSDMRSDHVGQYWIGGYEKLEDKPQGTLTSRAPARSPTTAVRAIVESASNRLR